jgi:hypothetical protein
VNGAHRIDLDGDSLRGKKIKRLFCYSLSDYVLPFWHSQKEVGPKGVNIPGMGVNMSGIYNTIENGLLYRYIIESSGALSINVIFSQYELPEGAKLFLYNEYENHVIGAFTSYNNKASNVLPVTPIKGDILIIEYFEPISAEFGGKLRIGKVNHDFAGFYRQSPHFGLSGDARWT